MIIEKLCLKNKFLKFEDEKVEFNRIGLYLITGKNGAGKSSIIQQIVFGKNNILFNSEDQKLAYEQEREKLIAYVPQNIVCPNRVTVLEYIKKGSLDINDEDIQVWLERFHIQDISFDTQIKRLSGGEKTKICIISAILKDTPYIFMDEPTNNLDNLSVAILKSVVTELAMKKTVIIISHDERFSFEKVNHVVIDDGKIISQNEGEINRISPKIAKRKNPPHWKKCFKCGTVNYISYIIILLCLLGIAFFNRFEYNASYCTDELPAPGSILIYQAELVYGELNETYVKTQNFIVEDYYSMIKFEDIPRIAQISGVNKIFIFDEKKYNDIIDKVNETEDIPLISVPEVIYKDYLEQIGISEMCALIEGEMPKDNANEIVLSKETINNIYQKENATEMIGQVVCYEGKEYKLVGISPFEIAWISYTLNDNLLFYLFDDDTYDEFERVQIAEKREEEYINVSEIGRVVLLVDENLEGDILNKLIKEYAADNYFSFVYSKKWIEEYNKGFYIKLCIINLFILIFLGIIVSVLVKNTINEDVLMIVDYNNYYLNGNKIICSYLFQSIVRNVIVIFTCIFLIALLFRVCHVELQFLIIDGTLLAIALCGNIIFNLKKGI